MNADQADQDGIEIHYDQTRGYIELACEPVAFRAYRELVARHLEAFPEIQIDTLVELYVTDTATINRRKRANESRGRWIAAAACIAIALIIVVGTMLSWFVSS